MSISILTGGPYTSRTSCVTFDATPPVKPFGELLSHYVNRAGISDAELARRLGVSRQTVFRWREGLTDRPRRREDIVDIATTLRLSPDERDEMLLAAGFSPESATAIPQENDPAVGRLSDKAEHQGGRRRLAIGVFGFGLAAMLAIAYFMEGEDPTRPRIAGAAPDETLILISPFVSYSGEQVGYNVAGRLQETLEDEFTDAALDSTRVEALQEPVLHDFTAQEAGERYGAQLVVWGEYDSGRVLALLTPLGKGELAQERRWLLSDSGELGTIINSELPEEVRWLALYVLGQIHLQAGRLDEAQTSFERALANPPEEPLALGSVYFQLGLLDSQRESPDLNKVVAYYTETLDLQPTHVSALNNRAVAYLARGAAGDLERAEADLRSAVELVPLDPVYLTNLALTLVQLSPNHLEEALATFERAAEQDPGSASVQNSLCWFNAVGGKPEQAIPHCDRAVDLDPSGYSNDSRGVALALLGRHEEAASEFRNFLDLLDGRDYDRFSPTRLDWIAALEAGQNPFNEATLQDLLNE